MRMLISPQVATPLLKCQIAGFPLWKEGAPTVATQNLQRQLMIEGES